MVNAFKYFFVINITVFTTKNFQNILVAPMFHKTIFERKPFGIGLGIKNKTRLLVGKGHTL